MVAERLESHGSQKIEGGHGRGAGELDDNLDNAAVPRKTLIRWNEAVAAPTPGPFRERYEREIYITPRRVDSAEYTRGRNSERSRCAVRPQIFSRKTIRRRKESMFHLKHFYPRVVHFPAAIYGTARVTSRPFAPLPLTAQPPHPVPSNRTESQRMAGKSRKSWLSLFLESVIDRFAVRDRCKNCFPDSDRVFKAEAIRTGRKPLLPSNSKRR